MLYIRQKTFYKHSNKVENFDPRGDSAVIGYSGSGNLFSACVWLPIFNRTSTALEPHFKYEFDSRALRQEITLIDNL